MKTLLLTGATGTIGTALRKHLINCYHFRCLDRKPISVANDMQTVDITDFEAVLQSMAGVDAVIHLAANPNIKQPWAEVYSNGICGTYNVFEAARQSGIQKIIYASSSYVSGWREIQQEILITPDTPIQPNTLYGVGKLFGEILGCLFSEQYQMSIICLRIGAFYNLPPQPKSSDDAILRTWCSPRDLAQLVECSIETEGIGFQIFYGISNNTRRLWDITNAQELVGYNPQDNAELLLDQVFYTKLLKKILKEHRKR